MSSRTVRVTAAAAVLLASGVARAQVADGDLLVPEYSLGSVVNARDGGDLSGAPRFATGLTTPMGLCRGPGGDVFVTEFNAGQVTIITAGGDFEDATPFAFNLSGPCSLLCTDSQILVTELNAGQITDITAGGNFAGVLPFARIDINPADLLRDSDGRIWVTSFRDGVIEITGGGDFRGDPYYAPNDLADLSSIALAQLGNRLLVGNEHTDQIVNFAAGGPLSGRPVFAQVRGVIGLRSVPSTGQLFAASELDDAIYEISAGGDYTDGDTPFATGLDPFDVAHLLYISGGDPEPDIDAGPEPDIDAGPDATLDAGSDPDAGAHPGRDGGADPDPDGGGGPGPGAGPDGGAKKSGGGGCSAAGGETSAPLLVLLIALIAGRTRPVRRAAPARRR
jgi:hypothetical protein